MPDVPKIVCHRLRASTPEQEVLRQAHPEADLLTAFAEQALSPSEREEVLQHLALCEDCRDAVVLALPNVDVAGASPELEREVAGTSVPDKERTNWLGWPNLHWGRLSWAALAAGVAMAVLVARPGLERLSKPKQQATSVATLSSAPEQPRTSASAAPVAEEPKAEKSLAAKTATARDQLDPSPNKPTSPALSAKSDTPTMFANNLSKKSGSASAPAAGNMFGKRESNESRTGESRTGAAAGGPAPAPSEESRADANLIAQADAPPIEKAKPAPQDSAAYDSLKTTVATPQAQAASPASGAMVMRKAAAPAMMASKQNATWTIAAGVLQRSLDNGQSWQTAVRADHALLCFASRGQQVWAGGQAGTLLRSTDEGTTWTAVAVSFGGQPLTSDVTHIETRSSAEVMLITGNHESWSSSDGGKTWVKK